MQYIIAYRCEINEEEAERFRKVFFKIDRDNNGYVTFENVKEFFSSYFKDAQQVRSFYDAMDIDGNGKVHWNEFLSCIISQKVLIRIENLREAFNFFDRESKGYFKSEDFKTAIGDPYLSLGGFHANFEGVVEEAFPGIENITFEDFHEFMILNGEMWRYI